MNPNQQEPVAPRVSILVDPAGAMEGSSRSSTTNGGSSSSSGIGGLRVNDPDVPQGNSPGSEDVSVGSGSGPAAIIDDDGDVARRVSVAAAKGVDTTAEVAADDHDGGVVDRVTPREGEAVNVTRDDDNGEEDEDQEEEVEDENQDEEDVADDESDYSYTYEDEDEGHYSGFLIPTDPIESGHNNDNSFAPIAAASAAASERGDHDVNVVAAEDGAAAGSGAAAAGSGRGALPRTISRAASGLSGTSSPAPEPSGNNENERKPKWREPTRAAVNMSLRAEKEKTGGRRRLASDLYKIMMADTQEAGFSLEPCDEDSMDKWSIKLFGFDEDSNLAKDLMVCGMNEVHLEMSFPDQYPFEPPFVRVVSPRFKRQTGFVMSGALCMELLTKDGWNPVNDIESVIVSIRSLMAVGDGRLQAAVEMGREAYKKALDAALKKKKADKDGGPKSAEDDIDDDDGDDVDSKSSEGKRKRAPSEDGNDKSSGKSTAKRSTGGSYTAAEAQSAYDHLSKYHQKEGWDKSGWWSRKG